MCWSNTRSYRKKKYTDEHRRVRSKCSDEHTNLEFRIYNTLYLTHCSMETPKMVIGKHWRPRSNAAERGV